MSAETPGRDAVAFTPRRVSPKTMIASQRRTEDSAVEQANVLSQPVAATAPTVPSADESEGGYLTLERKEARLREGQIDELAAHARRLNKAKGAPAPRITENTLIRVAVDLLLSRIDELQGTTEADLRRSIGI